MYKIKQKTRRSLAMALAVLLVFSNMSLLGITVSAQTIENVYAESEFSFADTSEHNIEYSDEYQARTEFVRSEASVSANAVITYTSSDVSIAEVVDKTTGRFKLHRPGTVYIIATQAAYDVSSGDGVARYGAAETRYKLVINKFEQDEFKFEQDGYEVQYPSGGIYVIPKAQGGSTNEAVTYSVSDGNVSMPVENGQLDLRYWTLPKQVTLVAEKGGNNEYKDATATTTILVNPNVEGTFAFEQADATLDFIPGTPEWEFEIPELIYTDDGRSIAYSVEIIDGNCQAQLVNNKLYGRNKGTVKVIATKAPSLWNHYGERNAEFTLTITEKREQNALTFSKIPSDNALTYNSKEEAKFAVTGGSGSGDVTYTVEPEAVASIDTDGVLTIHQGGTFTVTATKAEDSNYKSASVSYTGEIKRASQTINFEPDQTNTIVYGTGVSYTRNAYVVPIEDPQDGVGYNNDENSAIRYSVVCGNDIATVSEDGELFFVDGKTGTVSVQAVKPGNEKYCESAAITYSIQVVYEDAPQTTYTLSKDSEGKKVLGDDEWYNNIVYIRAPEGYEISLSNALSGNAWSEYIEYFKVGQGTQSFYLKKNDGGITEELTTNPIKIEKNNPIELSIEYRDTMTSTVDIILNKITFGHYYTKDAMEVILTATDEEAGIQEFAYSLGEGDSWTIIGADELDASGDACSYSFYIEPQFRGKVSFKATDYAGNYAILEGDVTLVIDSWAPKLKVSYSDWIRGTVSGNESISPDDYEEGHNSEAYLYYKEDAEMTFHIHEHNFYEEDVVFNDSYYGEEDEDKPTGLTWRKHGKNCYEATYRIPKGNNGEHIITLDYADRSGNDPINFVSEHIIMKSEVPKISVDYAGETGPHTIDNNGVKYFKGGQTAVIKITDDEFIASNVELEIDLVNATSPIDTCAITEAIKVSENWSKNGKENTFTINLNVDATYTLTINYKNVLETSAEACIEKIVIDTVAPQVQELDAKDAYNTDACIVMVGSNNESVTEIDQNTRFIYRDEVNFKFAVKEINFHAQDVVVTVLRNGQPLEYGDGYVYNFRKDWKNDPETPHVHSLNMKLGKKSGSIIDGNYQVRISYTDRSGNEMTVYTSNIMTIDTMSPKIEINYDNENAYNDSYYDNGRKATIKVTDANINKENIQVQVKATDVEGNPVNFDLAEKQSEWMAGTEPYTWISTIDFDVDANYDIKVNCVDMVNYGNDALEFFTVDKSNPIMGEISYDDSTLLSERILEAITFGYYHPGVTVKITADDLTSPIDYFEWSYDKQSGASNVNVETIKHRIERNKITYSNNMRTATAEFTLTAEQAQQYRGYISFNATDMAGNTSDTITDADKIIVIDTISPTRTVTYSPAKQVVEKNTLNTVQDFSDISENTENILFYDAPMTMTFEINEANFYAEDVIVKVNGERVGIINWQQNQDSWKGELTLAEDGDYIVSLEYKDRSQNEMVRYVSNQITIDTANPVVHVSYSPNNVIQQVEGIKYYDSQQTATITITERNFRAENVEVFVTAKDVNGADISIGDYASQLRNRAVWTTNGDSHTATIMFSTDANYTFDIKYTDLALRTCADYPIDKFTVDKTAPTNVSIRYNRTPIYETILETITFGFYDAPVTATISAEDSISGIYNFECRYLSTGRGSNAENFSVNIAENDIEFTNGKQTATATIRVPSANSNGNNQYNGSITVEAYDRAKNGTELADNRRLVVDSIAPNVQVEFSDSFSMENGISYYNEAIQGTISVVEANFYKEDIKVTVSKDGGTPIAVDVSWFNESSDRHVGRFSLDEDGTYIVYISYQDRSANAMEEYRSQTLILDTAQPMIKISGIKNHSANNEEQIGFVITVEDSGIKTTEFKPQLIAEVMESDGTLAQVNLTSLGSVETVVTGKSYKYTVTNLEQDGIYSIQCTASDRAGNETQEMLLENAGNEKITTLTFSVNRNGSTYGINEPTRQLNGTFSREAIDVVIYEINPNALSDNKITLYKNDETVELEVGKDYTINKEGGEETWNKYTYTIFKDNFQDDGIYRISTYSTDELGNISENTLDIKNMEIAFGIDKTAPKLIITNLESDTTYAVEQLTVIMYPTDNIKLCEVNVSLDGKEVAQWNEEQIEQMVQDNQDYTFDIPGNVTKAHRVTVELKDAAANRTVQEITNFYVTTDKWTQFHTNKVLVFGSVVCGVAGIGCGFVFLKRRF